MAEFISRGQRVERVTFALCWERPDGSGYSFDCDTKGNIFMDRVQGPGLQSLALCQGGTDKELVGPRIARYVSSYWQPAVIRCGCGRKHELSRDNAMGDSQCECGQWYNAAGQQLAPPSQWGEETGERFDDSGHYVGGGEE